MESTAVKRHVSDADYQNKVFEDYPQFSVSADQVKQLRTKKYNALFPLNAIARIVAIEEREISAGSNETFYTLEVREIDILDKSEDELSPEELKDKIEQSVEEQSA